METQLIVYIADLRIINKNMKILCDEQQCFYGEFILPATIKYILWNNQQMQLYAVNFIPLLGSLYMFRVFYSQRGRRPRWE